MLRLILATSENDSAIVLSIAAVTFSEPACRSAARSLAVLADFLTNSRAASGTSRFLSASVTGLNASLTLSNAGLVFAVIGSLHPRFELWAHPVLIGPRHVDCDRANAATQHKCC